MSQSKFQHYRKLLADVSISLTRKDGEYRVAPRILNQVIAERIAYYTDDVDDAYQTGLLMSQEPIRS